MELILHLGAHRTATGSLQHLLDRNAAALMSEGVAVWTPRLTRAGLLAGVMGDPGRQDNRRDLMAHRAAGRVALRRERLAARGTTRLVVSDPAMLGAQRENVTLAKLYPTAAARLRRVATALPGAAELHLTIRSPDTWWTSAFAALIAHGAPPPLRETCEAVARARRGWRQVIEDVAAALPGARLHVRCFEEWGPRPGDLYERLATRAPLRAGVGVRAAALPVDRLQVRLHDEGDPTMLPRIGKSYSPFTPDERAAMRAAHAEDLAWLRAGAEGLAIYDTRRPRAATSDGGPNHGRWRHARRSR